MNDLQDWQPMLIETLKTIGGLPFSVSAINVLIGSSGSGKTQSLLDIARLLTRQDPSSPTDAPTGDRVEALPPRVVLEDGQFISPLTEPRLLRGLHVESRDGKEPIVQGLAATLDRSDQCVIRRETWNVIQRPVLSVSSVTRTELGALLALRVAYLPAAGRRSLVAPCPAISPLEAPSSLLQSLQWASASPAGQTLSGDEYSNEGETGSGDQSVSEVIGGPSVEEALNDLVGELFLCRVIVDVSQHTEISLRVLPVDTEMPDFGSQRDKARWLSQFPTVDRFQDGVANFVAMGLAVLLSRGSVVLIDVPEMGLHPDACRHLGKWLAATAPRREVQLFLATHSCELIEGLQEGSDEISAIRLQRTADGITAKPVSTATMTGLRGTPYFRAQRAVAALFSDAIIMTDNEIERSIYRTSFLETSPAAHRLSFFQCYGLVGLEASMETIAGSGMPYVVLTNLELLGMRSRFFRLLELMTGDTPPPGLLAARDKIAAGIEEYNSPDTLAANTAEVEAFLDQLERGNSKSLVTADDRARRWRALRERGLSSLSPGLREAMDDLTDELKTLGIFVAPVGWVRNWFDVESRSKWFEESMWQMQREGAPPALAAFIEEVLFYFRS
jgi:energy-coupling factor transporter ATP-binding protein EcfA2